MVTHKQQKTEIAQGIRRQDQTWSPDLPTFPPPFSLALEASLTLFKKIRHQAVNSK